VPGAKSSLGLPATVTRPGSLGCLNWRWLPRVDATKLIYPDHRLPPWVNEDDTRDRSHRLLGGDFLIREMGRVGARGRMLDGD
jgi:hypothetical protein